MQKPTLARDAARALRLEGATHIDRLGRNAWAAYRPSPTFEGEYGVKTFWRDQDGWHLGEPWIMAHREPTGDPVALFPLRITQDAIAAQAADADNARLRELAG